MKTKCVIFLLVLSFTNLYSQIYKGDFQEIFTDRFAGAKNEAMGKILSVNNDAYFTSFSNPAIATNSKEISLYYSNSDHFYILNKMNFTYLGATVNLGCTGAFGFAMQNVDWGKLSVTAPSHPDGGEQIDAYERIFTVSYANSLSDIVNFGFEGNYFVDGKAYDKTYESSFFNFGLSKKFDVFSQSKNKDVITGGIQIVNIFGQGADYEVSTFGGEVTNKITDYFPSILRVGIQNEYKYFDDNIYSKSYLFSINMALEYEDILNHKYRTSYKIGAELSLLNILAVRCGYYTSSLENIYNTKSELESFTYGAGLNLDLRELTGKYPWTLMIDYVNLEQPSYITDIGHWPNFHTIQVRIRYYLEK